MKVTLIQPHASYSAARWEEGGLPPLGLGYLAAYLEQHGVDCEILDAHVLGMRIADIRRHLSESRPDIIGVTLTTENRFSGFNTIEAARAARPDALVIAGGPHVSAAAEDTLSHLPSLDLVVRGEGESTLLRIVEARRSGGSFSDIPGLSYRDGDTVVHNPAADLIHDLDSLPFPARHLMPIDKYGGRVEVPGVGQLRALNIMASRGCPFDCSFCASPAMWGRRYRGRSPENVLAEVDEVVGKYGAQAIWFFDDTFTVNKDRTRAICDGLASRHPSLKWTCEIRVDTVDRELLADMRDAGCYCVAFGVESGSQRIIDQSIGKRIRIEEVRQVVEWCRELGLQYNPFMIISHPDETEDDARQSMELLHKWKADGSPVSMAVMHIYPGTRIEAIARQKGILPSDFSWASKADLRRAPMLPAAQGDVPIFLDLLSWRFISSCLFEWAETQRYTILRRIPRAVGSIRSLSDVKRYWIMLLAYLGHRWVA